MTTTITMRLSVFALALLLAFGAFFSTTYAHEGESHDEKEITSSDDTKIAQMKQIITILTELIDLLKKKAELSGAHSTETEHHDESGESDELKIWVEVHSYKTHAHVQLPNAMMEAFIIEGIEYTDEEEVIEAIAKKTGLSEHDIEEVITFPEGELNNKGDSVDEHEEEAEQDVTGIHIMSDGKIMWGDSTEVHGATLTLDGKVKLSDGRIITPAFDLR